MPEVRQVIKTQMKYSMKKLQEKLLNTFLKATSDLKTKKAVEWALHDIYEVVYIIFLLVGIYAILHWSGVALVIATIIWLFLMYGWNAFSYKSRQILLGYLYPEGFDEKEMQENQVNNLLQQMDKLIKELNE